MRDLKLILILLFFCKCNQVTSDQSNVHESPQNSYLTTVKLIDSLGTITLNVPNRYDTFFQWTNWSDCGKPCAKEQYRFQPKNLRISKESGWIYLNEPKDSVDQFTILHSGYFPFREGTDSSLIFKSHQHVIGSLQKDPTTYNVTFDTVEKINDRYFSIAEVNIFDTVKHLYSKKVLATTTIKGNAITFRYDLLSRKLDSINQNFIKNSKRLLKSIKISNGI